MEKKILLAFLLSLFLIGFASATDISTCTTISSAGEYNLSADLSSTNSPCIIIDSNDVILDGSGFYINGSSSTIVAGIKVGVSTPISNLTLRNLILRGATANYRNVVFYVNSSNVLIENSFFASPTTTNHITRFNGTSFTDFTIKNNIFVNSTSNGVINFPFSQYIENFIIRNNSFTDTFTGATSVLIAFGTPAYLNNVEFTDNQVTGQFMTIDIRPPNTIFGYNVNITNNRFYATNKLANHNILSLTNMKNVTFSNNYYQGTNFSQSTLSNLDNFLVKNNTFNLEMRLNPSTATNFLLFSANVTNLNITQNFFLINNTAKENSTSIKILGSGFSNIEITENNFITPIILSNLTMSNIASNVFSNISNLFAVTLSSSNNTIIANNDMQNVQKKINVSNLGVGIGMNQEVSNFTILSDDSPASLNFLEDFNLVTTDLVDAIQITSDFVSVDSISYPSLNQPAVINLFNLPTNFTNPMILRDSYDCSESICQNFTDLNAGNVSFSVQSWSNYTVGESNPEPETPEPTSEFPNKIQGSGTIYEVLDSTGSGMGKFFEYLKFALPILMIGLAIVGIVIVIALSISSAIKGNLFWRGR